jgi:hypothetical protein
MTPPNRLQPGQRVQVIDPDDGDYLEEGEVEEVQGRAVFVRLGPDDTQQFRAEQLKVVKPTIE